MKALTVKEDGCETLHVLIQRAAEGIEEDIPNFLEAVTEGYKILSQKYDNSGGEVEDSLEYRDAKTFFSNMKLRIICHPTGEIKEIGCENLQYAFEVYHAAREEDGYGEGELTVELILGEREILFSGFNMVRCVECGATLRAIDSILADVTDGGRRYCVDCYGT